MQPERDNRQISGSRREFLKQSSGALAGAALAGAINVRARAGEDNTTRIALVGCGGQGSSLLGSFAAQKDVEVAYVCDVDANRMNAGAQAVEKVVGKTPKMVKDMRRILEDTSVEAVVIATLAQAC